MTSTARRRLDDALAAYRARRDFARTAEPPPRQAAQAGRRFVVQRHWARREHFDLRLELDGTLKSWAVTRGPSADPRTKRLAVRTEDHPIDYAAFEGEIPKGEYGGGTVMIWDRGTWSPLDPDPAAALAGGSFKFRTDGVRMKGEWALVRLRRAAERGENWLLVKHRDAFAEDDDTLATRHEASVASGRSRDEIAAGAPAREAPSAESEARSPLLGFVAPALCAARAAPPDGSDWVHEIKFDGYRLQILVEDGAARVFTRTGLDWTERFPGLAAAARGLGLQPVSIDGEAVVFDACGVSDFGALQIALRERAVDAVRFVAFDLLAASGEDVRASPLVERKAMLQTSLRALGSPLLLFGDHVSGDGASFLSRALARGHEGVVSKRASSPYRSGRSGAWIKVKGARRADVTVVGWMPSERGRAFASLLVGERAGRSIRFAGGVGTGFSAETLRTLGERLAGLARPKPAPRLAFGVAAPRGARWVEPRLEIEIALAGRTPDGLVRHARFLGVKEDRAPGREDAAPSRRAPAPRLTHPERVVFPAVGLTKRGVADYYEAVADRMLPFLERRPVSLVRAPDGLGGQTFFQRHVLPGMTKGVVRVPADGKKDYLALEGRDGLATAVQFGVVEIHGWGARIGALDRPDRMVFDLDPDESLPFAEVRSAARELRDLLAAMRLPSFPMLSGGKGVHVVVPLGARQDWRVVEGFAAAFAQGLARHAPKRYVAVMSKARRSGRIFVDWLRNKPKSTAILPYSLRARPNASLAAPVAWDDLDAFASADAFTAADVKALPPRPWDGYGRRRPSISPAALASLGVDAERTRRRSVEERRTRGA
jgi:bifunctional non-homologous end joining protein LigD